MFGVVGAILFTVCTVLFIVGMGIGGLYGIYILFSTIIKGLPEAIRQGRADGRARNEARIAARAAKATARLNRA